MPDTKKDKVALTQGQLKALIAGRTPQQIGEVLQKMASVGRRRTELDLDKMVKMRMAGCTIPEIAAEFDVDEKTIDNRLKDKFFADLFHRGNERGRGMIRMKQFQKAVFDGDNTMLIWCGKQRLGQRDRIETDPAPQQDDMMKELAAAIRSSPTESTAVN